MRVRAAVATVLAGVAVGACGSGGEQAADSDPATTAESTEATGTDSTSAEPDDQLPAEPKVTTVATGLEIPWGMTFLPGGDALVTERAGRVRLLRDGDRLAGDPVGEINVDDTGEGGLLGIAADPDFDDNAFVYLYRTTSGGNEVVRATFSGGKLGAPTTIVEGIPSAAIHDGGRIAFGPDDDLYISTGDASDQPSAQDPDSLAGKILRLDAAKARKDGGRPEVFSLGHRNPQGFDWQPGTDRLYENEHGPDGDDEVNLLEKGGNYGWPEARGDDHDGFVAPLSTYTPSIAPSGATFVDRKGSAWDGDYLVAALRGRQIRRVALDGRDVSTDEALFEGDFGRLRLVTQGPDGDLYVLTSNRDGRGSPTDEDDRILRITPPRS
ncbi:MAG: PQQ-dependent sugar dehydrogenase [Solirubrobacterales bacterium]